MTSEINNREKNPELSCVCKISEIIANNSGFESAVQKIITVLSTGFQYPSDTCIRIEIGGKTFRSPRFKETQWKLSYSFDDTEFDKTSVEVFYMKESPEKNGGPFTFGEKYMLFSVGNCLKSLSDKEHYRNSFHESEEKFAAFMDNALDGMAVLDFKGNILLFNKALVTMFEVDESEVSQIHNILDYLCEEYKIKAIKDQLNVIRGKGGYLSTYKVRSAKGRKFWVEGLGTKITYKGNIANIVVVRDITERKAAEDKLKDYRYKIDTIIKERTSNLLSVNKKLKEDLKIRQHTNDPLRYLESIGVMVVILNMDGHVSFINKKGCELLDYNENGIVGHNWISYFIPEEYQSLVNENFTKSLEGSPLEKYETTVIKYDGEMRLISWTNMPLLDDRNKLAGVITTGEDITDIRHSQEELQQYINDLRDSNEFKALFIDILRHDLLNPAGVIKGYSEVLLEKINEENISIVRQIYNQNEKLINVINTASTFGKLESTDTISFEELDLLALLKEVADGFAPLLEEKAMDIEYPADGIYIADINTLIEEAFSNLLSNAIKFSPHGSKLILDIADEDLFWKITFTDFGTGVSDKHKSAIFTRWGRFSGDGTKGSGLGLAIVKKIVELHNGEVGVSDNPSGTGSVFWIRLRKRQAP